MRVALLPLARTTFDMALAAEKLDAMIAALEAAGCEIAGARAPLTEPEESAAALEAAAKARPDMLLVLQLTFTDAAFLGVAADAIDLPLAVWAPREPRAGGRLRLNAFCGLNLAAHALGLRGRRFGWLYADPDAPETPEALRALLAGERAAAPPPVSPPESDAPEAAPLAGRRILRVGAAPAGFDTCAYDPRDVAARFGAEVESLELDALFDAARAAPAGAVAALRAEVAEEVAGLDAVDQAQLDRSLRLKLALDRLKAERGADAFALRCWPETFTAYGGAVCAPVAMMGEARAPCACEADVWGALTQLALQKAAEAPVFLVDLVDVDPADDSAVVWHCGQAPLSMAGAPAEAAIHSNRRQPLLHQFPLKPGRVTFLRLSQARRAPMAAVATGEMLARPMAFTGTSGVVRFDAPAGLVLDRLIGAGLEHHTALAYGDHADALRAMAAGMGLPLLDLSAPERTAA